VALVSFLVAVGAVFFAAPLVLKDAQEEGALPTLTSQQRDSADEADEREAPARPEAPEAPEDRADDPDERPAPPPAPADSGNGGSTGVLTELPKKVCDTVPKDVFLKWVPRGTVEEHGGSRAGSCGYSSPDGKDFRYLRLETRLGDVTGDLDPISLAKWSFGQEYEAQQKDDGVTKTILLEKVQGLGEEAFKRVYSDRGEPNMTTARIEVRVRNVIITVSYSRTYAQKPEEQQEECLEGALQVTEEALRTYS
jgi:hypothetical protein